MNDIRRFSSRRQCLDRAFLSARLKGALSYTRIAGNFRCSILELVSEAIAAIPRAQIVWNSEMDAANVAVSKHVRATALKERLWKPGDPEGALMEAGRSESVLHAPSESPHRQAPASDRGAVSPRVQYALPQERRGAARGHNAPHSRQR